MAAAVLPLGAQMEVYVVGFSMLLPTTPHARL